MKKLVLAAAALIMLFATDSYSQSIKAMVSGGLNAPIGTFGDAYKGGVSIEGGLLYSIPFTGIDLTLTAGYNKFDYKPEFLTGQIQTNLGVGTANFAPNWEASSIPVMVGIRYRIPMVSFNPYLSAEVGIHSMKFDDRFNGQQVNGSSSNPTTLSLSGATASESETGFGTAIGLGTMFSVGPMVSLDLNVKYNYNSIVYSNAFRVFVNNNENFTSAEEKGASFVTFRGGVVIGF